jgi:hypothetical protein
MADFRFEFEWEDPQAAQGAELRATWARLRILVDGEPVTRLLDMETRSIRDSVYLPLYPLAEWIALHWWHLLYEVESPATPRRLTYLQRHSFLFGREGYAMPDLRIRPVGHFTEIQWERLSLHDCRLEFISTGKKLTQSDDLRQQFQRIIDVVIKRLDEAKITRTLLHDEWNSITRMHSEEAEFCRAAAALGLDPFALDAPKKQSILKTSQQIPKSLYADFLAVVDPERISGQATQLRDAVGQIEQLSVELTGFKKMRSKTRKVNLTGMPWDQGYGFARALRDELSLKDQPIRGTAQLAHAFNVKPAQLSEALLRPAHNGLFEALVGFNKNQSPGFIIPKKRKETDNFAFCRALFEYLTGTNNVPSMIADLHTERQQRNRAFAAEFLAPARLIKRRLNGPSISGDQVQDLADEFCVSAFVIAHQINNHRLGQVPSLSGHIASLT